MFFVLEHAAVLLLLLLTAAGAGTLVMGSKAPLALRAAMGLAVAGQLFAILGIIGALRPWLLWTFTTIALLGLVAPTLVAPAARRLDRRRLAGASLLTLPLFLLTLYPPIAFDETLYHLSFVRTIARSGAIRFLTDARFPVFPQFHELLCVPAFLLAGDTATHLVALAEVIILAGLLIAWPQQRMTGYLAAALVLGNPIVIQIATVTYTEAALMLFVAAGFYCLDRNPLAAGFLLGAACSTKYLGLYFAAAGFAYLLLFGPHRRRTIPLYLGALIAAMLPMYGRIIALTGNPVFPFIPKVFGTSPWTLITANSGHLTSVPRLFWDITFARERVNFQPPWSPLFAVAMLITIIAATRDRRATFIAAVCIAYIAIFTFLPQDSRYLLPLLPLVAMTAATAVAPLLRRNALIAISLIAIAPGIAYAGYRLVRQGPIPIKTTQRQQYLEAHIPEYRALEHRGPGRIYAVCAEQLKYYGGDDFFGDVEGPYSNETIIGRSADAEQLWRALGQHQIRYLLISRKRCPSAWQHLPAAPWFELVYEDAGAVLWRVDNRAPRIVAPSARRLYRQRLAGGLGSLPPSRRRSSRRADGATMRDT